MTSTLFFALLAVVGWLAFFYGFFAFNTPVVFVGCIVGSVGVGGLLREYNRREERRK